MNILAKKKKRFSWSFENLIRRYDTLSFYERRRRNEDYDEVVIFNREFEQFNRILTQALGPAAKPAGARPTSYDEKLTQDFGGIHSNQTLFRREIDGKMIVAMLWPWGDDFHTTLKVVSIRRK